MQPWARLGFNSPQRSMQKIDFNRSASWPGDYAKPPREHHCACEPVGLIIRRHEAALTTAASATSALLRHASLPSAAARSLPTVVINAHTWPTAQECQGEVTATTAAAATCAASDEAEHYAALGRYVERSRRPFIVLPRFLHPSRVESLRASLHAQHAELHNPACGGALACRGGAHTHGCHRVTDGMVAL